METCSAILDHAGEKQIDSGIISHTAIKITQKSFCNQDHSVTPLTQSFMGNTKQGRVSKSSS